MAPVSVRFLRAVIDCVGVGRDSFLCADSFIDWQRRVPRPILVEKEKDPLKNLNFEKRKRRLTV
jgi:hypothetical protein